MRILKSFLLKLDSGQALVETAIVLPFLLTIFLNVFNIGFFFLIALNVAVAPRAAGEYSIMGFSTAAELDLLPAVDPPATNTTVSYTGYQDMYQALASYTTAKIQICSGRIGYDNFNTSTQKAQCKTCTSSTSTGACGTTNTYTTSSDPESPAMLLHQVDITYQFSTPFPGAAFNIVVPKIACSSGTCFFHRRIVLRSMR
jgi:hypothetical protein